MFDSLETIYFKLYLGEFNFLQFLEKHKMYTKWSLDCQRARKESNSVLFGLALASSVFPPVVALMILHPVWPENRFFTEYLEIPLSSNTQLSTCGPIVTIMAYSILCIGDLVFAIDFFASLYHQCCVIWTKFLQPISINVGKWNDAIFTCSLGCKMS